MSEGQIIATITHGVGVAGYYSDGDAFHPFIGCLCNFETHGSDSWEDAGAQFDEHLSELKIIDFKARK